MKNDTNNWRLCSCPQSLLDFEFSQQAETDFGQIHQTVNLNVFYYNTIINVELLGDSK